METNAYLIRIQNALRAVQIHMLRSKRTNKHVACNNVAHSIFTWYVAPLNHTRLYI